MDREYPEVPDLVAISDMPELFGCSRQWVDQMRYKKILLEPDVMLGRTPGWIRQRALDWWEARPDKRPRS